jgi:hypothetical protein
MNRTDTQWSRAARAWLTAKAKADAATTKLAKARSKILELAGTSSCEGAGVTVKRYFKAGSVDYASIPELRAVDLDRFRKPGRYEFRIEETRRN